MSDAVGPQPGAPRSLRRVPVLILISGLTFAIDLGGGLVALLRDPASAGPLLRLHLLAEFLATAGLARAFVLMRADLRRTALRAQADAERLHALRADFDRHLRARFAEWGLTAAEADVALLTIRGLKIAEIAAMRGSQIGTVKAQLSAILRKSGCRTRTELVARFIDEFLDRSLRPL